MYRTAGIRERVAPINGPDFGHGWLILGLVGAVSWGVASGGMHLAGSFYGVRSWRTCGR
jgi:hypothetical protein